MGFTSFIQAHLRGRTFNKGEDFTRERSGDFSVEPQSPFCDLLYASISNHGSSGCVIRYANVFQWVFNKARGYYHYMKLVAMLNGGSYSLSVEEWSSFFFFTFCHYKLFINKLIKKNTPERCKSTFLGGPWGVGTVRTHWPGKVTQSELNRA